MVGALYSCYRQKNRRFSVVGHRRGIHALDCLLFKFFSFTLGLTHGLVVAGLEALVAVGASIAECLLLHHGKRCNGCLAAIQHHIATRVAVGIFFARSFLNQIANTIQILIGQLVGAILLLCRLARHALGASAASRERQANCQYKNQRDGCADHGSLQKHRRHDDRAKSAVRAGVSIVVIC